jgi:hypothetical protein
MLIRAKFLGPNSKKNWAIQTGPFGLAHFDSSNLNTQHTQIETLGEAKIGRCEIDVSHVNVNITYRLQA